MPAPWQPWVGDAGAGRARFGYAWLLRDRAFVTPPATRGINKRLTFPHRRRGPLDKSRT